MNSSSNSFARGLAEDYLERLRAGIGSVPIAELERVHLAIVETRGNLGSVWICGNGGSSATASHMQVDLSFGVHPNVRARSMSDNSAALTATGNDIAYDDVFSRQLELEATDRDMLVVISASGNSANLLSAVASAKRIGMKTCAFVGFDGGKLKKVADIVVHTPTRQGDYGVAEDLHGSLNHILKEMLNGYWGNGKPATE